MKVSKLSLQVMNLLIWNNESVIERAKMDNVIKQLKQFKTDAIYEKKKHYNAADRKRKYCKWISFAQIILNTITGTTLFAGLIEQGSIAAELVALLFAIMAAILASVQKIFDFENQAQGNQKAADMYLGISKKINLILNFIKDGVLSNQEIVEKTEEVRNELSRANEIGSQFSTSQNDYKKAQIGIKSGEESYTDEELNLWE